MWSIFARVGPQVCRRKAVRAVSLHDVSVPQAAGGVLRQASPHRFRTAPVLSLALGKCLTIESQTNFEMGEPRISISDVSKKEGKRNQPTLFTFTVSLSTAYDQPVTVSFRTVNGTARTSDSD